MLRDLRYAVRVLSQAKGWTAVVLVSLALGIGANTALFSAINGILLRPLAISDPDGLVRLSWSGDNDMVNSSSEYGYSGVAAGGERRRMTFSYPAYEEMRAANRTLLDMFVCAPFRQVNVVVDGQAEVASAFLASGTYFDVLGVGAAAGRTLTPADDDPAAAPAAMISHGYWSRRFGRSDDVIGKVVTINGRSFTIIGVTPPDYAGVQRTGGSAADVHLPLAQATALGEPDLADATYWWLQILGRLRPGVTAEQVRGNLEGTFQAAARRGMEGYLEGLTPEQRSLSRNQNRTAVPRLDVDSGRRGVYEVSPDVRRDAVLLGWVVVLVLLIVCANVGNLLLSRAAARQREISVRLSVGATRGRLVRQLVTEGVFLSAVGGALGLLVAYWGRRLLPFGANAPLDWRLFGFVAVLSLATGILFSLVPAIRTTGIDLSSSLKDSARSVAGSKSLLGRALLVVQVAVSLVLVVGAGLFLGTLRNLRSVDVGFNPGNLLLLRMSPSLGGYEPDRVPALYREVQERLAAVPAVQSVGLSQTAFLSGSTWTSDIHLQGRSDDDSTEAHLMTVSPEFLPTMQIPLLTGRLFEDRDGKEAGRVAIINAAAAREWFGNEPVLGRRFGFSPEERGEIEIIGVVRNVKYASVRDQAPPTVYLSYLQEEHVDSMIFELRTAVDPRSLVPAVREAIRSVDPDVPVTDVSTQMEEIEGRFREERFYAMAYALFGGLATLLAAIGLFGLASYGVARRTREIGVRMALGARGRDVFRLILGESLRLVAVGIVLGLAATLVAGRFVQAMLYGVAPTDGLTMFLAVVVLVLVAALASYVPARRASRVDAMVALQYE